MVLQLDNEVLIELGVALAWLSASIDGVFDEKSLAYQASGANGIPRAAQVQDREPPTSRDYSVSSEGHSVIGCAISVSWERGESLSIPGHFL